jgi:hypothetical protein
MSTKTFKVGENGYCPKYKLFLDKNWMQVQEINWDNEIAGVREFNLSDPNLMYQFSMYMENETTSYYTDKMWNWIKSRKEYVAPVRDPFTTYTFSL